MRGWVGRDHENTLFWGLTVSYQEKDGDWLAVSQSRATQSFRGFRRFLRDFTGSAGEDECGGTVRLTKLNGETLAAVIRRADGFVAVNTRRHPRALLVLASPGPDAEARAIAAASPLTRGDQIPRVPRTVVALRDLPTGSYTWDELIALGVPHHALYDTGGLPVGSTDEPELLASARPQPPLPGTVPENACAADPAQTVYGIGLPPTGSAQRIAERIVAEPPQAPPAQTKLARRALQP